MGAWDVFKDRPGRPEVLRVAKDSPVGKLPQEATKSAQAWWRLLPVNAAGYGGDGKHPPIRRNGTDDTDGQGWFSFQRWCDRSYS